MKKRWRRGLIYFILAVATIVCICYIAWANTALVVTEFTAKSERVPTAFSGFRIAQVSDLHNAEFGKDNEKLLKKLKEAKADIIVLTGDIVDSVKTDIDVAARFADACVSVAPTYYVSGNHEARIEDYERLETLMIDAGVTVLKDEAIMLRRGEDTLRLVGVQDPSFFVARESDVERGDMKERLRRFTWDEQYTVLLSHRPELFDLYADVGADLVLSGHAHGGQFRIPLIGGLFAPDQGLFPKYDAGAYTRGRTTMFVSRGVGNSLFPMRINNRPEVVVVTLQKAV